MEESVSQPNRRTPRSNVLLKASIEVSGHVVDVKLRNLSAEGALIEGDKLPVEGSQVLFRRNDLAMVSRVAWVHDRHAGIAFATPLAAQDVLRNVPRPKPRVAPDFRRPGLACRKLTAEEQRLVDSWISTPVFGSLGE